jgi:hypothetical protein
MGARGHERPIWIGDTFGGTRLNGWGPTTCPARPNSGWLEHPATEADRCRVAEALEALASEASPRHPSAIACIRAESASGVVRKVVVAAGEGSAGINIGNVEDWEPWMLTQGGEVIQRSVSGERLSGFDPRTYVYRFALDDGGTVIVAWADTGLRLPGNGMATTPVRSSLGSDQPVRVEWTVTTGSEPVMELVKPEGREVVLALGQIPALVWIGE